MSEFEYNYVDSSYARIVLDYGIIFSVIILIGYTILLVRQYKSKNYWLLFSIIFILIWSFVEQYLVSISKNIFILAFIPLLQYGEIEKISYKNEIGRMIKKWRKNEKISN